MGDAKATIKTKAKIKTKTKAKANAQAKTEAKTKTMAQAFRPGVGNIALFTEGKLKKKIELV